MAPYTEEVRDLDKLDLFKFGYGGLVIANFQYCPSCPKNDGRFKSAKKIIISQCLSKSATNSACSKNNHISLA